MGTSTELSAGSTPTKRQKNNIGVHHSTWRNERTDGRPGGIIIKTCRGAKLSR